MYAKGVVVAYAKTQDILKCRQTLYQQRYNSKSWTVYCENDHFVSYLKLNDEQGKSKITYPKHYM